MLWRVERRPPLLALVRGETDRPNDVAGRGCRPLAVGASREVGSAVRLWLAKGSGFRL